MKTKLKEIDKPLLFSILALLGMGLMMIASAGVIYGETRFGDSYYFFKRQLMFGVLPGMLCLLFFQKFDYHRLKKIAVPLFLLAIVFLVLVFIPGVGIRVYGANRWVSLGPVSFQPSEMAKIAIILYMSAWLSSKGKKKIGDLYEGFMPFMVIIGVIGFLIIKQPDMGTLGLISLVALSIYFASGAKMSHIMGLIGVGVLSLALIIAVAPYRRDRLMTFLDHKEDPRGSGYQINQALIAIGSGGVMGVGLGHSRQKFNYLPEPVGDSIFAVLSEELGLLGGTALILLFVVFAVRGFRIAKNAPDEFGRLVAVGVTVWVLVQSFVNISAISGIIPLTGVPLPFVSYGGTSLLFLMMGVGILLNVSRQTHE